MSLFHVSIILWCLLSIQASGDTASDNYSFEYEEYEDGEDQISNFEEELKSELQTPEFVSQRVDLVVTEEETVRLPCLLERLDGFTLLWKKDGRIISVGNNILDNPDSRFSLDRKDNGNYLIIGLARISDEGSYECQVSSSTPKQISHTVKIRVMPILSTFPEKYKTAKEGEIVRFKCTLTKGNPKPRLFWRKKQKELLSDMDASEGEIVIKSVQPADAGLYQCVTAANNEMKETIKEIELFIEYGPRVSLEQTIFKGSLGEEIHLTCVVEGFPKPTVLWRRNGVVIDDKSIKAVINNVNDRHNIILIDEEDEGVYDCQASNYVGQAKKSLNISGSKCDSKLNSIFKIDNEDDYGGVFEVKICTEEINKEDKILSEFQSYSAMSQKKPLTYPKLEIRNFYLEKQNDVTEEGRTEKSAKEDISSLARFSYIAQMRNTMQKESLQDKTFIDMEKFNNIIKQYCDLLMEKKAIQKEDILRIENQKQDERKHRMNLKSPNLAGILENIFSPISKIIKNSILDKTKRKSSKSINHQDSIVSDGKKSKISSVTSTYDSLEKSISIEDIFGMSSTHIQVNDTFLDEKEESKDYQIHEGFLPPSNPVHPLLHSNKENEDFSSYSEENKIENDYPDTPITLGEIFGLSSSFSLEESVTEGEENGISKSSIFRPTQNTLTYTSESMDDSISIEDIFGMSNTFVPTNGEKKDKSKNDKIHKQSQSNIKQETSIKDIAGLSSSSLAKDKLNKEEKDISDYFSFLEENNIDEDYQDRQISLGKLLGLSSSFSSGKSVTKVEEKEILKSSKFSPIQNAMTSTSEKMDNSISIGKASSIKDMGGLSSNSLPNKKLQNKKDHSVSIEGIFGMSSTFIPNNDMYTEEKGTLKDEMTLKKSHSNIEQATSTENVAESSSSFLPEDDLHIHTSINRDVDDDRPITAGELFGLSSSFSSVEISLIEEKDEENITQVDEEEPVLDFETFPRGKETFNSKMTAPKNEDTGDTSLMSTEGELHFENEVLSLSGSLSLSSREVGGNFEPMKEEQLSIFTTHGPITSDELGNLVFKEEDLKTSSDKETEKNERISNLLEVIEEYDPLLSAQTSINTRPSIEKEGNLLTKDTGDHFSDEEHIPLLASQLNSNTMTDNQSNEIIESEPDKNESHYESLPLSPQLYGNFHSSDLSKLLIPNFEEKKQEPSNFISTENEIYSTTDEEEETSSPEEDQSSLAAKFFDDSTTLLVNGKNSSVTEKSNDLNNREEKQKQSNETKANEVESLEENLTVSKTFEETSQLLNQNVITSDKEGLEKFLREYDSAQINADAKTLQVANEHKHGINDKSNSLAIQPGDLVVTSSNDVLPSEESIPLIENLVEKKQEQSDLMSNEMHPKPMYLAQQNPKEESSEHNESSDENSSELGFEKDINEDKVLKDNVDKKNYSFEVLFLEEDKASIDIDYPESVSIENSSQESQSKSIDSPIFYIKQNNKKSSNSEISYQPMFNASNSGNPWYKKFEFFCVGKNVLMVLKKKKSNEE